MASAGEGYTRRGAVMDTPGSPPRIAPVFPLTGCLLLPGTYLPLNVFEPRYRNLVSDTLARHRHIGMVQPRVARPDNWGPSAAEPERPDLYSIGCLGQIDSCEAQPDGRYLLVLRGVSRFRLVRELPMRSGYRRFQIDCAEFAADREEHRRWLDPIRLLTAAHKVSEEHELEFDFELLQALPGVTLLNALCVALPFSPVEKQALLEAADPGQREELLLTLIGMGLEETTIERYYSPPTVN